MPFLSRHSGGIEQWYSSSPKTLEIGMHEGILEDLARQRHGWSLEQAFYRDPSIFAFERSHWFNRQWTIVGHRSELPRKGDYIVRPLFDASVIVVNAGDDGIRAYHNVCTHRGSRICKSDGHAPTLVCPYHAWAFRLTGELRTVRDLPEGVDPAGLGLREIALREVEGLLLGGLDPAMLPDPSAALAALVPALKLHGIANAKVIERRSYPTAANWKLVLENFFECYHCRPSHPEYFRMNGHVSVTAIRDDKAAAEWNRTVSEWETAQDPATRLEQVRDAGAADRMKVSVYRQPIGLDRQTHSRDGKPVATLMGGFNAYDGGETALHLGRFSFLGAYNDHAVLFQFLPRGPEDTDVVATWFGDEGADPTTIDIESLVFLWDVTTKQDKQIIEENAAGVRSPGYAPGPYTQLESQTAAFVADYVEIMRQLAGG